jgi:hypothetical protein
MSVQGTLPFGVQETLPIFLFLSLSAVSLFSFAGVAVWSSARRWEREAYYKNEMLKKVAESDGAGVVAALELLREQDRIAERQRRDGAKLGGLVTVATGIGLLVYLRVLVHDRPVYLCGLIPLLIGGALLTYAYVLSSKE